MLSSLLALSSNAAPDVRSAVDANDKCSPGCAMELKVQSGLKRLSPSSPPSGHSVHYGTLASHVAPYDISQAGSTCSDAGVDCMQARNMSSALSAASSVCDHIRDWVHGTPPGHWVSMGVLSDGSYGVPEGLCYSFPVTCQNGDWSIVQGLPIDARSRHKMDDTARELEEERQLAREFLQDSK